MHYFFLFRNYFFYNIDNTKFENYLQSCFKILFVLSKFKIITFILVMNAVNILSEHVDISY